MKTFKNKVIVLLSLLLVFSCNEGIDPITEVAPGTDASAPQVNIKSPTEGLKIKVNEILASVNIGFEVTDDIEVASVKVIMDGNQIGLYDSFIDYRRFLLDGLTYDKLADGAHILTVTATDMDGKTTSASVNFEKEPAYVPKYPNELLYVAFDGDYTDLISFEKAAVIGSPAFSTEKLHGTASYKGTSESYITFSPNRFKNAEFSAVFWMKINAIPDRAGILALRPAMINGGANNDLTKGFSFFRENGAAGNQRFKLNVGSGTSGNWFDGGAAADVAPNTGQWVNFAFTISGAEAKVYINGQVVKQGALADVDWTGCTVLSIMSGAPNFTEWGHGSDQSLMDELRIFDRAITQQDIQQIMSDDSGIFVSTYPPNYPGEMFYMPFDGNYKELFRNTEATKVGSAGFAGESKKGSNAYKGATDSYLTFPTEEKGPLTTAEFSATMWYKMSATPNRAGILVMGPPDEANPANPNNRKNGFRFFRESGAAGFQRFKLNVGNGTADTWIDGGAAADVANTTTGWIHLAFTISSTKSIVYINGVPVKETAVTGVDWTGCNVLSIMSGAPRFTGYSHFSDSSVLDELHLFKKELSPQEVLNIMNN